MHLSALVASALLGLASAQNASLGQQCQKDSDCPAGVSCYAVNSMQIPTCGSFQAVCTSNAQCATNACNNGFCNGALKSTTSSAPQSTSTASPGSVFLGQPCNPNNPGECVYASSCYAVNSMQIPTCGGFQAVCNSNAQCATNTCSNGFCSGLATPGATKLGQPCSPNLAGTCVNSQCYAVNAFQIPICGNFQASCTSDSQCAVNTCVNGACSGVLQSSASSKSLATSTGAGGSATATTGFANSSATATGTGAGTTQQQGSSITTVITSGGKTATSVIVVQTTSTAPKTTGASTSPTIVSNSAARLGSAVGLVLLGAAAAAFAI